MELIVAEIEQKALDFFYYFTPLIQLWAAICLLFFYVDDLLKKSPLFSLIQDINDKCNEIVNKFQGYSLEGKLSNIDSKQFNYVSDNWDEFRPRIKNIAVLTFFYCVFVIFIIGFGKYNYFKHDTPNIYIISTSLAVLIFDLCCALINKSIFKFLKTPILYAFFILPLLYISCFKALESLFLKIDFLRNHFIYISGAFVLLTCLFGVLAVLIYIGMVFGDIKPRMRNLVSLSDDLDQRYEALFSDNPLKELPQQQQTDFVKRLSDEMSHNGGDGRMDILQILWDFIDKEAQNEFNDIMNKPNIFIRTQIYIKKKLNL